VNLGAKTEFNFVALLFTNAPSDATWRIRTADTEADLTASPLTDTQVGGVDIDFSPWSTVATRRHGFLQGAWNAQWVRIDIDATGASGGLSAGRLYIAQAYVPTWPTERRVPGFLDTSARTRTTAGNTVVNRQGVVPTIEFEFNLDDEAEFYQHTFRIQQLRAASRDVLVALDPDDAVYAHDKLYYGYMKPTMRTVNEAYRQYVQRYEIEGII